MRRFLAGLIVGVTLSALCLWPSARALVIEVRKVSDAIQRMADAEERDVRPCAQR